MRAIAFAATKGGTGKTTIAANIAVEAARCGSSVFLRDSDPVQALARLWQAREAWDDTGNPKLLQRSGLHLAEFAKRLKDGGASPDYLMIDTPGSHAHIIEETLDGCDLVVMTLQPSPLDLSVMGLIAQEVERMSRAPRAVFVLNRADPKSPLTVDYTEFLKERFGWPIARVRNRAAYARAAVDGHAAIETNKEAAAEIGALWSMIEGELRNGEG